VKVCILGRGKLGTALMRGLALAGVDTVQQRGRPPWRSLALADVYLLAVPDASLHDLAKALGPRLPRGVSVLHCAGARSPEELAPLRVHGVHVGALHPLLSFADRRHPPSLQGATFVAQGDPVALRRARRLVACVKGHWLPTTALGPGYHAAAALVANGGVALASAGLEVMLALGLPRRQALRGLAGLLRSVANNLEQVGLPGALTGPVARGDAPTVAAHLAALRALAPVSASTYASVQPLILAAALQAGLPPADARRMRALLARQPQRKT
jgi:predicted short-subunit dehydrogenase-like oxidoreductase (DUF2520 family)